MAVDNDDTVAGSGDCRLLILFYHGALDIHGKIQTKLSKEVFIPAAVSFNSYRVISIKTLSTLDAWSNCDRRTM
jgi:hypothetical protein